MAHVLIIGASRGVGLETVRQALAAGHAVRAFARSARDIGRDDARLDDTRLERREGDARDTSAIAEALQGTDAVIQAIGTGPSARWSARPVTLFSETTGHLVQAMQAEGPRRLIAVSGFGAGETRERFSTLERIGHDIVLGRAYEDKTRQEEMIRDSSLDWTIVRPTILTPGPRTGRYRVLALPAQWRNGLIARADVADFLVRQIEDRTYLHRTPVLAY
jgi:putative NADH-flavin reductase